MLIVCCWRPQSIELYCILYIASWPLDAAAFFVYPINFQIELNSFTLLIRSVDSSLGLFSVPVVSETRGPEFNLAKILMKLNSQVSSGDK